jgi:hypothetical protein
MVAYNAWAVAGFGKGAGQTAAENAQKAMKSITVDLIQQP